MLSRNALFAPVLILSFTLLGACKSGDARRGGSLASGGGGAATGGSPSSTAGASGAESAVGGASSSVSGAGGSTNADCQGSGLGNRLCAAFQARHCDEPLDCSACAADAQEQRKPYEGCAACALAFDAWYQCAVSAFDAGKVADGVHCVDGHAEVHPGCGSYLASAIQCNVDAEKTCPKTWPR